MSAADESSMESFISSTIPAATSTATKKKPTVSPSNPSKTRAIHFSERLSTESSLGILDNLESYADRRASEALRKEQKRASDVLERSSKAYGLPSKYLRAASLVSETSSTVSVKEMSTVSESDFKVRLTADFSPNNVSTPRQSVSAVEVFYEASNQLLNTDISLSDICSKLRDVDTMSFKGAEQMREQLRRDEEAWRRAKSIPKVADQTRTLETTTASRFGGDEQESIGEYFKTRKNDLGGISKEKSPNKGQQFPLIDVTNCCSEPSRNESECENSLRSISQLQKAITAFSPGGVLELINKKKNRRSSSSKENDREKLPLQDFECRARSKSPQDKHPVKKSSPPSKHTSTATDNRKSEFARPPSSSSDYSKKNDREKLPIQGSECRARSKSPQDKHPVEKSSLSPSQYTSTATDNRKSEFARPPSSSSNSSKKNDCEKLPIQGCECRARSKSPQDKHPVEKSSLSPSQYTSTAINNRKSEVPSPSSSSSNGESRSDYGSRCPSSLDSFPEGKLPIKGSKLEMVWGCVKLRRSSVQSCAIRNQLQQKIRVCASVTGTSFRIVKEEGATEMLTSLMFTMHPLETKYLSVMFCPNAIGAVSEKLKFQPMSRGEVIEHVQQCVMLCAYGGHVSIDAIGIAKESNSKAWLSLGVAKYNSTSVNEFKLKNNGILSGFAILIPSNDKIAISPKQVIIKPGSEVKITISYASDRRDFKTTEGVFEVGTFKIITGAEAVRGRLRKLCESSGRNIQIEPFVKKLIKLLPNEDIPTDIAKLVETPISLKDLLEQLDSKQVHLTIEKDVDATIMNESELDQSDLYHTLMLNNTVVSNKPEKLSKFQVEPVEILFLLPGKKEDIVVLHSNSSSPMTFEAKPSEGLEVIPAKGTIPPEGLVTVRVIFKRMSKDGSGKVLVYIGKEVIQVLVKVMFIKG